MNLWIKSERQTKPAGRPKREQQTPFLSILFSLRMRKERKKLDCLLAGLGAKQPTLFLLSSSKTKSCLWLKEMEGVVAERLSWMRLSLGCLSLSCAVMGGTSRTAPQREENATKQTQSIPIQQSNESNSQRQSNQLFDWVCWCGLTGVERIESEGARSELKRVGRPRAPAQQI